MHTTGHMDTGFDTDMRATVRASKVRAAEQQQRYWCYKEHVCARGQALRSSEQHGRHPMI
jgi:hypothetical protein